MPTLEENVNRVKAAKTAIGNAITAKGGTVASGDGLEDLASDIATIPSGGSISLVKAVMAIGAIDNSTFIAFMNGNNGVYDLNDLSPYVSGWSILNILLLNPVVKIINANTIRQYHIYLTFTPDINFDNIYADNTTLISHSGDTINNGDNKRYTFERYNVAGISQIKRLYSWGIIIQ